MILSQFEQYSETELLDVLRNAKENYLIACVNFEFEEQNMLKEKIKQLRLILKRRQSGDYDGVEMEEVLKRA